MANTTPRLVRYTNDEGVTMDGILLSPAETGEGTATDLVIPLDRANGKEATAGTGPGTYTEILAD